MPIDRTNKTALDTNLVNGVTSDAPKVKGNNDVLYNFVDGLEAAQATHANAATLAHPDGSVKTAKIADGAITEPKYATGSVSSRALGDGVVTPSKLSADAQINETVNNALIVSLKAENMTVVNVKTAHKAKGDGVTDDTAAIQAALDAVGASGGTLYFPPGTYIVKTTNLVDMTKGAIVLTSDHSNIRITGAGYKSIIKAVGDGTSWFMMFKLTTAKNVTIYNLMFDGNADANWATDPPTAINGYHLIYFNPPNDGDVDNITIHNCKLRGSFDSAIQGYGAAAQTYPHPIVKRIRVMNCLIEETGAHGVGMGPWHYSSVIGCTFRNVGKKPILSGGFGSGMAVDVSGGCDTIVVADNVVDSPGYAAFKAETHDNNGTPVYSKNVIFANNVIKNIQSQNYITTYAFRVNGERIKVVNNIVDGYYGRAVDMDDNAVDCLIEGNTFINGAVSPGSSTGNGISLAGFGGHTVKGNILKDGVPGNGIDCAADNCIIEGNIVHGAVNDGILINAVKNVIVSNNSLSDNENIGIVVAGADRISICNNQSFDARSGASRTQTRGIYVATGATNIELQNNQCWNNNTKDYDVFGWPIQKIENGRRYMYAAAAPNADAWSLGDETINTNPSEQGAASSKYVTGKWICVVAGSPGTWVEMRSLTGN